MSAPLPDGLSSDDEIAVVWETDDEGGTKVVAELGGASFTVATDADSAHLVPWLVASANQILEAAYAEMEDTDAQEAP